jgi:hypothetical protein
MDSLFQIVYTSTASGSISKVDLMDLLKGSVQRNSRAGITGLLLYKDGGFMQALEGERETVVALFAKISRDPRHHNVIPLISEPIERRNFQNSAMAFRDLDSPEVQQLPGYSDFLNTSFDGNLVTLDLPKCQLLLQIFKKNVR